MKYEELNEQLVDIRATENEFYRATLLLNFAQNLSELAQNLDSELKILILQEALAIAREIKDDSKRARILFALLPYLKQDIKKQVLQEAFDTIDEIKDEFDRFNVLMGFAQRRRFSRPHSNSYVLQKSLAVARNIKDARNRARALLIIAPYLDGELQNKVIEESRDAEHNIVLPNSSPPLFLPSPLESISPHISTIEVFNRLAKKISFTAYHPKEGNVETWHTLLVYTHIASMLKKVQSDAKKFDHQIESPKQTTSKSSTPIARGTELTIVPSCEGVTFNPERVSLKWMEDFHRVDFRFKADKFLSGDAAKGSIDIYVGPLIIGTLKFAMLFNEKDSRPDLEHEESAIMYGKDDVFISYSRKDSAIARTFKTVLESTGLDVFLDVDDIRSGQLWEDELKRRIERAQIFQIFWSSNYSQSENCKQEWEYALKQNKDEGYIRPVFWEKPLSPKPPEELNKFNFKYVELK